MKMQYSQKLCFFLPWLCWVSANHAVLPPFCFFPFENLNFNKPSLFWGGGQQTEGKVAGGTGTLILSKPLPAAASQPPLSRDTDPAGLIKESFYFSVVGMGKKPVLIHLFFTLKRDIGCFHVGWLSFLVSP